MTLTPGQTTWLDGDRPVRARLTWSVVRRLGWAGHRRRPLVDLDLSCLLLDAEDRLVEAVWFGRLASADGSVRHSGESPVESAEQTADDAAPSLADPEQVSVLIDLPRVSPMTTALVLALCSFPGKTFALVRSVSCRLVDAHTGEEHVRCQLPARGAHTAQVVTALVREEAGWTVTAIGETGHARTAHELLPLVGPQR